MKERRQDSFRKNSEMSSLRYTDGADVDLKVDRYKNKSEKPQRRKAAAT